MPDATIKLLWPDEWALKRKYMNILWPHDKISHWLSHPTWFSRISHLFIKTFCWKHVLHVIKNMPITFKSIKSVPEISIDIFGNHFIKLERHCHRLKQKNIFFHVLPNKRDLVVLLQIEYFRLFCICTRFFITFEPDLLNSRPIECDLSDRQSISKIGSRFRIYV